MKSNIVLYGPTRVSIILSGQQATFTVTYFADAFIAVNHTGCTVVSRTSAAMRARDGVFWNGYLTIASTGLADSLPTGFDPAGCAVVHRSSTAMKASDQRHVCSSLVCTLYILPSMNNGRQARWSPAQDLSTPPDA
jgi:hypothetical protein